MENVKGVTFEQYHAAQLWELLCKQNGGNIEFFHNKEKVCITYVPHYRTKTNNHGSGGIVAGGFLCVATPNATSKIHAEDAYVHHYWCIEERDECPEHNLALLLLGYMDTVHPEGPVV